MIVITVAVIINSRLIWNFISSRSSTKDFLEKRFPQSTTGLYFSPNVYFLGLNHFGIAPVDSLEEAFDGMKLLGTTGLVTFTRLGPAAGCS